MTERLLPVFGWYWQGAGRRAESAPERWRRIIISTSYCQAYISTSSRAVLCVHTAPGDSAHDVHHTRRVSRKPKDVRPELVLDVIRTP